ncbi:MAG TPA: N-acetylmuramoyl-L-alanine amidase, partial [Candidatus Eisenbacteria bacterium]|nr:N-acetylmuramoyl-L-alanine amidase [Candidatus Eisenbacteria bacterium]
MKAPRARKRRAAAPLLVAVLLVGASGCGRRAPSPVPVPPTPSRAVPGYEQLADSIAALDTTGLAGRRIAIDPGHGGWFRGALGVNGLTEAEVNLAVALNLRDLLAARGAVVFLTRDRDRDFLTASDSTLRTDLIERSRLANAFGPDLFVSIHHNADAGGTHDVNETQTYYKLGDDGPSLDVAQDVHRALVRNVGIRPHKVVPGNYLVLRQSEAPGILTETSYITFPEVEKRLRSPEKQLLEAQALLIGIARYFARRVPAIETFEAFDPEGPPEDSVFVAGMPRLRAWVRGEFDEVRLDVDGVAVSPERRANRLEWRNPVPWSAGDHEARLLVRLSGVGSARERRVRFTISPATARLRASLWPDEPVARGGIG